MLDLFHRTGAAERDALLALLNVRYLVSPNEDLGGGLEPVRRSPGVNLFRVRRELPRAFLAERAVVVRDRKKILSLMADPSFRPRDTIYLEEGADGSEAPAAPGESRVTFADYGPNHVQMDVVASDKEWLFFSDTYYPGWSAWIDGKRTRIHRADYAFKAVRVPPGRHRVSWRFRPISLAAGTAVSLMTLFLLGVCAVVRRR